MNPFRHTLSEDKVHASVQDKVKTRHRGTVEEVQAAVDSESVVVVGMAQNPHVKKARRLLKEAGIACKYLEYGSYLSQWQRRLSLKMWSGWPTFPMVFVNGTLVGGASDLKKLIDSGEFSKV